VARIEPHARSPLIRSTADRRTRAFQDEALGGRVILDNATFERCKFQGAVLVYTGGVPPTIRDCSFEKVSFEFDGAAGRTLAMLQAMSSASSGLRDIFKASFPRMFGH
jgi:hypothetical protein